MKNFMIFLLAFILLFHFPSGAQTTGTQLSFNSAWGVDYESNMVAQPSAQKNLAGFVGGVGASAIRDTSAGNRIDNIASYQVTIVAGGYAEFLLKTPNDDQTSGDCGFNARIKGPVTGVRAEITNGSLTVLAGVDLFSVDSWTDFEPVRFPCGAAGTRRIRFRNTTGSSIVFNVGRLFYGRVKRDSAVPTIPLTPYTPSVTGLGSGSGTFQYANYTVDTNGIAEVCLRFTKDGTNGSGTSEVAFSLPAPIANYDSSNGTPRVGTGFSGISNNNIALAVESSSGIFVYNGSTRIRGVDLSGGAVIVGCARYKVAGFGVQPAITPNQWNYDWRTYTLVVNNLGTGSYSGATVAKEMRKGGDLYLSISMTKDGSNGSGTAGVRFCLPPGLVPDVNRMTGTGPMKGYARASSVTTGAIYSVRIVPGENCLTVIKSATTGDIVGADLTAGSFVQIEAGPIPIVGWTETQGAPQLVGSVTSNSSNALRIESVITGTTTTTCTSSPCPKLYDSSGIFTVTRSGAGLYQWSVPAGTWSAVPSCSYAGNNFSDTVYCNPTSNKSLTGSNFACRDNTGALRDVAIEINCIGPR